MWFQGRHKQPPIRHLVGEGSTITGELRFTDGVRIDGEVHGDVIADGSAPTLVVIGDKARIRGRVIGGHVIISGEVSGAVESHELLELRSSARIDGDVRYEALEMHKGASISGELRPLDANERLAAAPNVAADATEPAAPTERVDPSPSASG